MQKEFQDKRAERILKLLRPLEANYLNIINNSGLHSGHAGDDGTGQTHYKIEISSPMFHGVTRVECHRMIHEYLSSEFSNGLHALEIKIMR